MDDAGERARQLRREGKTIAEIKEILGVRSNDQVSVWLRGVPPAQSVFGRKAKLDKQAEARELRLQGKSYNAIAAELGVSKSSVSVWCRDIALTEEQRLALLLPMEQAQQKRGETARAGRIRRTELIHAAAAAEIGQLSDRELFLVGVALYWAEGTKQKPWNPSTRVTFINSDPGVILTFIAWLRLMEVHDVTYRLAIHESADVDAATSFWSQLVGVPASEFQRPTLKRHNPRTVRRKIDESYVGCLIVQVRRSTDLNRRIAGWWAGIAAATQR